MNKKNIKADEMEKYVNLKAMQVAYTVESIALLMYCIWHLVLTNELPSIIFLIFAVTQMLYFAMRLLFLKKMTEGEENA